MSVKLIMSSALSMKLLLLVILLSLTVMQSHGFSVSMNAQQQTPYCINLKCTVEPSRRGEFLALVRDNQRLTLQDEPEALHYVVGEDTSTPNTFYIHEQFTSHDGFLAHKETPHNANWQEFRSTEPFTKDPVVAFYHGTHECKAKIPIRSAYCVDVQLCIDENVRDEFLEVIQQNARGSNEDEPLCLQYVWGESISEKNTFYFHEEYIGKEGFDAHAATPHFQKWEAFAAKGEPFTKAPVVNFYETFPIL